MRRNNGDLAIFIFALGLTMVTGTELRAQASHQIDRKANQIVVNTQRHWENWEFPPGTLNISGGQVQPRRWAQDTNAMLSILHYLRQQPPDNINKDAGEITLHDAIRAGSNAQDVVNVLDGDLETYWEPDAPASGVDLAAQWWFTVDLGRIVIAKKLVVRFVDEELGDPFLQFDVLVSDGQPPISASSADVLNYLTVIQTLKPNKSQRHFEIDLSSWTFPGRREKVARFVQVVVHGSDLDRGREVSAEQYDLLDAEDRGVVEYTKRHADGRESVVRENVYKQLESERQGNIRYFRRERPRLAELEVWGDGDDIAKDTFARGGTVASNTSLTDLSKAFDGVRGSSAALPSGVHPSLVHIPGHFFIDLGSFFWIDRLIFITDLDTYAIREYDLEFSNGTRRPDGSLKWITRSSGEAPVLYGRPHWSRHDFEPVKARFVRLAYRANNAFVHAWGTKSYHVSELQLFGAGFQPEVHLQSPAVALDASQNLSTVEWDADTPSGTQVQLQTRTGNTLLADTLFYKTDGSLFKSRDAYYSNKAVRAKIQGEKKVIFNLGPDWSGWSAVHEDPTGSLITSPSPRSLLKMRAILLSDTPETAATLKAIRLNFAEPVAENLVGSIAPGRVDSLGVPRQFTLFVRPENSRGFNELLLTAPLGMTLGDNVMYAGAEEELQDGVEMGHLELETTPVATGGDTLHLRFPLVSPDQEVIRLDFEGTVYSFGGQFQAFVRQADASGDGVWQRVDPEPQNPTSLHVLAVSKDRELLGDLHVQPPVFTPNGDGFNDEVAFDFAVFLANLNDPVAVGIYDLSGRLIRTMGEQREVSAGRYRIAWDGFDDGGELVPPGLYSVLLTVDAVTGGSGVSRKSLLSTVGVAY